MVLDSKGMDNFWKIVRPSEKAADVEMGKHEPKTMLSFIPRDQQARPPQDPTRTC